MPVPPELAYPIVLLLIVYPPPDEVTIVIAVWVFPVVAVLVALWKNLFPLIVQAELLDATRIPLEATLALK